MGYACKVTYVIYGVYICHIWGTHARSLQGQTPHHNKVMDGDLFFVNPGTPGQLHRMCKHHRVKCMASHMCCTHMNENVKQIC